MSRGALLEMICDWRAMNRAKGMEPSVFWYTTNMHKMILSNETRDTIHKILKLDPYKAENEEGR